MRKRLSAPSRSFLIINSRKSRAAIFGLGACLILAPLPAAAQAPPAKAGALNVALLNENNRTLLTLVYRLESDAEFLNPIDEGLKSRVVYTLQLVERRTGVFSLLGDSVAYEKTVEYTGYKDFYENVYVLEDAAGGRRFFPLKEDFAQAFLTLARYPLDELYREKKDAAALLRVKATLYPVKLVAPLTLMYFLSSSGVSESEWQSVVLP